MDCFRLQVEPSKLGPTDIASLREQGLYLARSCNNKSHCKPSNRWIGENTDAIFELYVYFINMYKWGQEGIMESTTGFSAEPVYRDWDVRSNSLWAYLKNCSYDVMEVLLSQRSYTQCSLQNRSSMKFFFSKKLGMSPHYVGYVSFLRASPHYVTYKGAPAAGRVHWVT
jgi:hypothetical protein